MTDVDERTLTATRIGLHGLAEQVLAAANRRSTGSIRLFVTPDGGLATPELPGPVTRLTLLATGVRRDPDGLILPLSGTLGELADGLGLEFGLPDAPYHLASGCGPEHVLDADPAAVEELFTAWATGDAALRRFDDQTPVVWPEHLDVAITRDEVNYGVSPGDGYCARPYAYVGPHRPRTGDFWNAPFGAARPLSELPGVDAVLGFFQSAPLA